METKNINGEILTLEEAEKKNSKLIWSVVQRYKTRGQKLGQDPDDLYNLAFIGFAKAFNNFKPEEYAVKFSTYAVPMMIGELQRWFRDNVGDVKFSRAVIDLANKIGRDDMADEKKETIANHYDVTLKQVNDALGCIFYRKASSTDEVTFAGEDQEITLGDMIGDDADYSEVNVNVFLDSLEPRNRKIVELTLQGLKQEEVGEEIGISQVQVSRLLKKLYPRIEEFFGYPIGYFQERKTINAREEKKEMAKKRGTDKKKKVEKGNLELAKELLLKTNKKVGAIIKETGISSGSAYYWAGKLRPEAQKEEEVKPQSTENYYLKPVTIKDDKPEVKKPVFYKVEPIVASKGDEENKELIEKLEEDIRSAAGAPPEAFGEPLVVQTGSISMVELGVPPVDLDADAAARKADEEHAEKMRAAEESAKLAEEHRQNLLNRSERSYGYSIVTRDVTPSDLHTLFTQVGHATSMSGIDKVNVSVVVTTESI